MADWTDVPDVPFPGGPDLPRRMPNGEVWPDPVRRWWRTLNSMPHCTLWAASDWQFALDTAWLKASFVATPRAGTAAELRSRERVLGTTADYRHALRIRYVDPAAGKPVPEGVASLDDYREL